MAHANLQHADCTRASFHGTRLTHAHLESALLVDCDLTNASLFEAQVDNADFTRVRGLTSAYNVHTVRLVRPQDVRYFESVVVPQIDRIISWERIRWLGRLHLFGASYAALVAIPFLYYLLDIFNRNVETARVWARNAGGGDESNVLAEVILRHLHPEPIPSLSLLLLISTILLGVGATIFAAACPPRIREFNREQWRDQLGHSLIHYLPFSWRYRWLRIFCLAFYIIGGVGVLIVLCSKLWNVGLFIYRNS
jgi:hypothetical protein